MKKAPWIPLIHKQFRVKISNVGLTIQEIGFAVSEKNIREKFIIWMIKSALNLPYT